MGKETSSINGVGNRTAARMGVKLGYYPTPYENINSKWLTDLNIRLEIINF